MHIIKLYGEQIPCLGRKHSEEQGNVGRMGSKAIGSGYGMSYMDKLMFDKVPSSGD